LGEIGACLALAVAGVFSFFDIQGMASDLAAHRTKLDQIAETPRQYLRQICATCVLNIARKIIRRRLRKL